MKSLSAQILLNQIDITISNIELIASHNIINYSNTHPVESSLFAGYLVVYICGIYEEVIETIVKEKFARVKRKYISRYVELVLGRSFRNPKTGVITELLNTINKNWGEKIDNLPERNKSALNSIVGNKNGLAHGRSINVTLREVIQFYNDSKVVIEKIDDIVL